MRERSPQCGLLTEALHEGEVVFGVGAELLYHLLPCIRVFICADADTRTAKHRLLVGSRRKVLAEQRIHKCIYIGIRQVEMIHTVFLRGEVGPVVGEGERVGRGVDFRNDLHTVFPGQFLQRYELRLRVAAVFGGQSGIGVALQAEGRLRLQPVVVEVFREAVVVQVQVQCVHLVVAHQAHQPTQIVHRDVFPADIEHESAQRVLRHIDHLSAGKRGRCGAHQLQQRARSPEGTARRRTRNLDHRRCPCLFSEVPYRQLISFQRHRVMLSADEHDVALPDKSLAKRHRATGHLLVVAGERRSHFGHTPRHQHIAAAERHTPRSACPRGHFRNDQRLFIRVRRLCPQAQRSQQKEYDQQFLCHYSL